MTLTFSHRGTCALCGARIRGGWVTGARINKRSLKTTGGILFLDPRCHECGFETHSQLGREVWALDPKSAAAVQAYRERRWAA